MLVEMFSDIFCRAVNLPRLQILRVDGGRMINDVIMHTAHDVSQSHYCLYYNGIPEFVRKRLMLKVT